MAFITVEDIYGSIEVIIFPNTYQKFMDILKEEEIVVINGRASIAEDQQSKVISQEIYNLDSLVEKLKEIWIRIPKGREVGINVIKEILDRHIGTSRSILFIEESREKKVNINNQGVKISEELKNELIDMLGSENIFIKDKFYD